MRPVLALLALVALVSSAAAQEPEYVFTIDGKPAVVEIVSLSGRPDRPAPGDLVRVSRFEFVLGEPGRYDLVATADELLRPTGEWTFELLAVRIEDSRWGRLRLEGLTERNRETLKGVQLQKWWPGTAELLAAIDFSRASLAVNRGAIEAGALRELPASVRYLRIEDVQLERPGWAGLRALKYVQILITRHSNLPIDLLSGARDLRMLVAPGGVITDPSTLASHPELRRLDLSDVEGLDDLFCLGSLASLRHLDVSGARVSTLPDVAVPELEVLRALAHGGRPEKGVVLDAASVAGFRERNPRCRVVWSWTELFREEMATATRIRVRTGGGCWFDPEKVRTLLEVREPAEVRAFVAGVEIDDGWSGRRCACCGDPTFEFYRGEELLQTVSFHHARRLRGGAGWPGDAVLTEESRFFVGRWLAERGVEEPLRQMEKARAVSEAREVRRRIRRREVGEELAELLEGAWNGESLGKALRESVPEPVERAALILRLLGCHEGSWNRGEWLEALLLEELVESISPAAREEALSRGVKDGDPSLLRGAARWLIAHRGWKEVSPETREPVLPPVARSAVAHPRLVNRCWAIMVLDRIGSNAAIEVIEEVFLGEIPTRALPPEEAGEPSKSGPWFPYARLVSPGVSARTVAAYCLARRGRMEHLPAIEAMLAVAQKRDRPLLSAAITWLRNR